MILPASLQHASTPYSCVLPTFDPWAPFMSRHSASAESLPESSNRMDSGGLFPALAPETPSPGKRGEWTGEQGEGKGVSEGSAWPKEGKEGVVGAETEGPGERANVEDDQAAVVSGASGVADVTLSSSSADAASSSPPGPASAALLWEQVLAVFPAARMVDCRGAALTPESVVGFLLPIIKAQRLVIREQRRALSVLDGQFHLARESEADVATALMQDRARLEEENRVLRDEVVRSRVIIPSLMSRKGR